MATLLQKRLQLRIVHCAQLLLQAVRQQQERVGVASVQAALQCSLRRMRRRVCWQNGRPQLQAAP